MAKKKKYIIYSDEEEESNHQDTPDNNQQKLVVRYEVKGRGGKKATLIEGFKGTKDDLKDLAKKLKAHCGTGGSVVENAILIQGEQVKKVALYLRAQGYKTNNV